MVRTQKISDGDWTRPANEKKEAGARLSATHLPTRSISSTGRTRKGQ